MNWIGIGSYSRGSSVIELLESDLSLTTDKQHPLNLGMRMVDSHVPYYISKRKGNIC